ncbi:hypothetical protein ACNKHP_00355 [Shigella boydii]
MGAVDLVIRSHRTFCCRGLQRIGRAGHQVGGVSKGLFFPVPGVIKSIPQSL